MNYLSSDCHNFLAEMEQQFPDKIFRRLSYFNHNMTKKTDIFKMALQKLFYLLKGVYEVFYRKFDNKTILMMF